MPTHTFSQTELESWIDSLPQNAKRVLVTGVFDLLHDEHKLFLQKSKEIGDYLLVGIETDSRVKLLKGENRPIWNQDMRYAALENETVVDFVFVLPEDFSDHSVREQLIAVIKPDFLAVSSHSPHLEKKKQLIEKYGGKLVVVHQHNPDISTTKILSGE